MAIDALIQYVWSRKDSGLNPPVISIIDDDELVRDAVKDLVRSLGYLATAFASAEDYLQSDSAWASSCLITDIQMPGMSGAQLQDHDCRGQFHTHHFYDGFF